MCAIPSKVNWPMTVPTNALTLTHALIAGWVRPDVAHATVVDDVHVVLLHTSAVVMETVAVKLVPPKFRPLIWSAALEVSAALTGSLALTNGAAEHIHARIKALCDVTLSTRTVECESH